jgi:4-hydroxy-tetrahydrodipicolinate reductase
MKKIDVILIGYGNTGKIIARYVEEHGGNLCAVVDADPRLSGTPVGNATVTTDIDEVLRHVKADIAIISTGGGLEQIKSTAESCLKQGINVITTSEESIFPRSTSPSLLSYLDGIAKEHGCTMTASGFQDCFWVHAVTAFASSVSRIDRIRGTLRYNIDEYGPSLAADHGVGLSVKEFNECFNNRFFPSYLWNVNELLATKLGWGKVAQTQKCTPYVYHERLYSAAYGETVERGKCVGMSALVTTTTQYGGIIETECIGKVYTGGDKDICSWSFVGEPSLSFDVNSPKTLEHTAASIVNRIPQVIRSVPGYVTINQLGYCDYLTFPMFLYTEK